MLNLKIFAIFLLNYNLYYKLLKYNTFIWKADIYIIEKDKIL